MALSPAIKALLFAVKPWPDGCPICGSTAFYHSDGCSLDVALRAAGLPTDESREAAKRKILTRRCTR